MERAVGIFVGLATLLLLSGFFYYLYHTATRKGWFLTKVTYFTYVDRADGLKVGDPVKLMGLPVGEIAKLFRKGQTRSTTFTSNSKSTNPTTVISGFPIRK